MQCDRSGVDDQYECYWTAMKAKNYCCVMPVFDTNDALVSPDRFAKKLVDAMCKVTNTTQLLAIERWAEGKWSQTTSSLPKWKLSLF